MARRSGSLDSSRRFSSAEPVAGLCKSRPRRCDTRPFDLPIRIPVCESKSPVVNPTRRMPFAFVALQVTFVRLQVAFRRLRLSVFHTREATWLL